MELFAISLYRTHYCGCPYRDPAQVHNTHFRSLPYLGTGCVDQNWCVLLESLPVSPRRRPSIVSCIIRISSGWVWDTGLLADWAKTSTLLVSPPPWEADVEGWFRSKLFGSAELFSGFSGFPGGSDKAGSPSDIGWNGPMFTAEPETATCKSAYPWFHSVRKFVSSTKLALINH